MLDAEPHPTLGLHALIVYVYVPLLPEADMAKERLVEEILPPIERVLPP
jgi:hypothetical protein